MGASLVVTSSQKEDERTEDSHASAGLASLRRRSHRRTHDAFHPSWLTWFEGFVGKGLRAGYVFMARG